MGSHLMNDHSSRSHSMLTVYIDIESVRTNNVYPQYSILLSYLSVSTRGVIGQFCGPYFTVRPAKLELVSFPTHLINIRDTSYGSSFFPVHLWPVRKKTRSVTYNTDLDLDLGQSKRYVLI